MNYELFIFDGMLFVLWFIIFLLRKDLRKEMLILGVLFGLGGILSEFVYIKDWWSLPAVNIWNFWFGFSVAGISSSIYLFFFNRKLKANKKLNKPIKTRYILILFIILFFGSFFILKNSFYSSLIAYIIGILIFMFYRKDLIKYSLFSGVLMMISGIFSYLILLYFYPNFITDFWYLSEKWYTKLIFGIPLEEYIWYFLNGVFISCIFKYSKKLGLRK